MMKILKYTALILLLALSVKLIWFEPEINESYALKEAREKLKNMSQTYLFDVGVFGEPNDISGNVKDGYIFTWYLLSKVDNTQMSIIIGVSKWDDSYRGMPFMLDCRKYVRDDANTVNTRQKFSYLCKKQ